jgi:NAD(P)H-dependent FMN reductase
MIRLLGISGSLRAASFNTALLRAAQSLALSDVQMDAATLHGIPLYDGDLETREGLPPAVLTLRDKIQASDGLLLVTPEYNNGIPGVFKNAIDWVSRTSVEHPSVLANKPVAVIGASPGAFGTISAQAHWLPVLRTLGMCHWAGGRLMVSRANTVLHDQAPNDAALTQQLQSFVQGFAQFVQVLKKPV